MPLIPAFTLKFNQAILPGNCAVGLFDGKTPSLSCATTTGKVLIHSPNQGRLDDVEQDIRFLNINQRITCLAAGRLNPELQRDMLCVGTETNLLGYDIEENSDILYKEVADGIYSVVVGTIGHIKPPLAIVGGNCAIQGYDFEGSELYWTVTGDNVTALALCDVEEDGVHELLVGSEDFEIRIFQGEEVISELTETEKIQGLCTIEGMRYGYSLANGTVGVYRKTTREWRHKTKSVPNALTSFDLDSDGKKEVIVGWSNGCLEVRHSETGEVIYQDNFPNPCVGLVEADYRDEKVPQIICCASDGEVRGYCPVPKAEAGPVGTLMGRTPEEITLEKLNEEKQEIMRELKTYSANVQKVKTEGSEAGLIPTHTRVAMEVEANPETQAVEVVIRTNNDTVVKMAVIFADQIFDGESFVVHPALPPRELRIPLKPSKDLQIALNVKATVGYKGGDFFHVFEEQLKLPKFAMFMCANIASEPRAGVVFQAQERMQRILLWLQESFVLADPPQDKNGEISMSFVSLRDREPLVFKFFQTTNEFHIKTESVETAGDIVQDLATYLELEELECQAEFPAEMAAFQEVLNKVAEYNVTRQKLTAEMADSSNLLKSLVVKAEDARLLGQTQTMKKMYTSLYDINRELTGEYIKRANNHRELLACLKEVNQMIQKASRLRVGNAATRVVQQCREAVKRNNINQLFKIIGTGTA